MSLVPPGTPPRVPAGTNMSQRQRLFARFMKAHIILCVVMIFAMKLCLHKYQSPAQHSVDNPTVDMVTLLPYKGGLPDSPLQELFRSEVSFDSLSDDERAVISDIQKKAALDVKFFAIPETVYADTDSELLSDYVESQLKLARDVLTETQGEFVLQLIESGVAQGSLMKKELGDKGSLKNSIVVAFLREDKGNLHFAMVAVSVEPRLGWRFITKRQRNEWNEVLGRVADTRLKQELGNLFDISSTKRVIEDEKLS